MRIDIIEIDAEAQIKIYEKHGVLTEEITNVLKEDEPIFRKAGGNQAPGAILLQFENLHARQIKGE